MDVASELDTKSQALEQKFRCEKCGKMLARLADPLTVEIKCLRCGTLNRVLEKTIEQVIITDSHGIILFINAAVETATGYAMHEAVGKKPSELWGGNMPKEFYTNMWEKMLGDKKPVKLHIKNKRKTGELYDVDLLVSPILDPNGKVMFFVGIEIIA